jgi:hypothetical protein
VALFFSPSYPRWLPEIVATQVQPPRRQLPIVQFLTTVIGIVILIAVFSFARTMLDNYWLAQEKAEWQAKIDAEQAEYDRLLRQKEFIESDAYQSQLAHEMGLYAPNERPLVVVLPPDMQADFREFDPVFREADVYEPPYWQQWWRLFFGERE